MSTEEMYVIGGERYAREGEVLVYSVQWAGFTAVSSGVTTAYKNGVDISSSCLSGSEATSGNVQTLRILTVNTGYGGSKIILEAKVDVAGGMSLKVGIPITILKAGQET